MSILVTITCRCSSNINSNQSAKITFSLIHPHTSNRHFPPHRHSLSLRFFPAAVTPCAPTRRFFAASKLFTSKIKLYEKKIVFIPVCRLLHGLDAVGLQHVHLSDLFGFPLPGGTAEGCQTTDNVYYVSGQYGGWREKPLLPKFSTQEDIQASGVVGKSMRVLFPIQIENVTNEYTFEFCIDGAMVGQ